MDCLVCSLRLGRSLVRSEDKGPEGACWAFAMSRPALEKALGELAAGPLAGHGKKPQRLASAVSRELGWIADDVLCEKSLGSLSSSYAGEIGDPMKPGWAEAAGLKKRMMGISLGRSGKRAVREEGGIWLAGVGIDSLSVKDGEFEKLCRAVDVEMENARILLGGDLLWARMAPENILGAEASSDPMETLAAKFEARVCQGLLGAKAEQGRMSGERAGPRL